MPCIRMIAWGPSLVAHLEGEILKGVSSMLGTKYALSCFVSDFS